MKRVLPGVRAIILKGGDSTTPIGRLHYRRHFFSNLKNMATNLIWEIIDIFKISADGLLFSLATTLKLEPIDYG